MTRISLTREFFIPAGAVKVADKASDAVAYIYTDRDNRPCARVFYGKQAKPALRAYFRDAAKREASVSQYFESRRAAIANKNKMKADRKASAPTYAAGDVLSTCWGYEQTNREFYEVIRVKGASVTVRQIATETVATGHMTDRVIPLPGAFVGEEITKRAGGHSLRMSSCQRATHHQFKTLAGVKVYEAVGTSSYA